MRAKRKDTTEPEWGLYSCSGCQRLLELDRVVSATIERHEDNATGYIVFQHFCTCTSEVARVSRRWGSYPSFLALFGGMPDLPYESSFEWQPVADDDPVLARWRWEVAQLVDADEFMLFANEAARRDAA